MKITFKILAFLVIMFQSHLHSAVITSASSGNFNSPTTWVGGIIPGNADDIIIAATHSVVLTNTITLRGLTVNTGGLFDNGGFLVSMQEIISGFGASATINGEYTGSGITRWEFSQGGATGNVVDGTGIISTSGPWTFGAYVNTIANTASLTVLNSDFVIGTISGQGMLICDGNINFVNGNILINPGVNRLRNNGSITLTNGIIDLGGSNTTLYNLSTGVINVIVGDINVNSRSTVDNSGIVTVGGNVIGTHNVFSSWINRQNATVNIAGSMLALGQLVAYFSGNSVNYNGTINQDIKNSNLSTYWHLKCSNAATKNLTSSLIINGDLTIQDAAQLDVSPSSLPIKLLGNWINTSTNTNPFVERAGLVSFAGTTTQSITANLTNGETFYNLNVNNTSTGLIQVNSNINITDSLRLIDGLISTGAFETNLNNSALGAIIGYTDTTYINGNLRRKLLPAGGVYDFPIGNSNAYELATLNLTAPHTVDNILANFSNTTSSTGLPLTDVNGSIYSTLLNCGGSANGIGNANDGIWSIISNTGTATYNLSLYGKHYSNSGINQTILKRVNASAPWALQGTYMAAAGTEPLLAFRNGLNSFSQFAIGVSNLTTNLQYNNTSNGLIKLYPNPATEFVYINTDNETIKYNDISLYDVLGNKTLNTVTLVNNQYVINRNGLASGIYVLKIKAEEKTYTQKIIFE